MAGMVYDGEYTCKQIGKINWRGSRGHADEKLDSVMPDML